MRKLNYGALVKLIMLIVGFIFTFIGTTVAFILCYKGCDFMGLVPMIIAGFPLFIIGAEYYEIIQL